MKPDCGQFETLINASLDGELTPEEERSCRDHLGACAECRSLCEQLELARGVLRASPNPVPPQSLLAAIGADAQAELRSHDQLVTLWGRWRGPAAVAVAAAAVLMVFAGPWHGEQQHDQPAFTAATVEEAQQAVETEAPSETLIAEEPQLLPAEAAVSAEPAAISAEPVRPRRAERIAALPAGAPQPQTPAEETPADDDRGAAVVSGPELAFARRAMTEPAAATTPVMGRQHAAMQAQTPRITMHAEELKPVLSGPSRIELELASGVIARMVVDKFIAEHMVETPATLLAVVTDTPTSELGPVLTEDVDNAEFGLSFTESMRRALTEKENQVP